MTKRVFWQKGMRLTDEILTKSDKCHLESLSQALIIAANGRFGLLPSKDEFNISLSISNNIADVEALSCLALTKSGALVDLHYDTAFANNMETRVTIPMSGEDAYMLCVVVLDSWKESCGGFCEPEYKFVIVKENTVLDDNMLPIARIINEYGWRIDEINFLPPCLYIMSHSTYKIQAERLASILKTSSNHLFNSVNSDCKTAISIFLPIVEQLKITLDKEIELMTPMQLFGNIQKYISGFLCACTMDDSLDLADVDMYRQYVDAPFNYNNVYLRIKEGLEYCNSICEKLEKIKEFKPVESQIDAPTISNDNLCKKCTNSKVRIPIENIYPGATVYYTIDGSEPTNMSDTGNVIIFSSGFTGGRNKEEEDKIIVVKLKAILNGVSSVTNTFKVKLQKDIKHWIEI